MKIYLASGNQHKLNELQQALLASGLEGCEVLSADRIGGMPAVEETGDTFEANAILKAEALSLQGPDDACYLADDSGIEIDFLEGRPGVRSARYAGEDSDDEANNLKVLSELSEVPDDKRGCRFRCVLALVGRGRTDTFSGSCEGNLLREYRGSGGFGYDPLFLPLESSKTFAEITSSEKAEISHRARALIKLVDYLRERLSRKGGAA
tara:strand:+ start:1135 stop:1758 length:624 start_codon:yes stop_codon:yes gene_type:complete